MLDYIAVNRHDVGYPAWKVSILAAVGKLLGVQFKIFGLPFGASYRPDIAEIAMGPSCSTLVVSGGEMHKIK